MKKYLLILLIFTCASSFGQEKLDQSIELQESSIYYFVGDEYFNNFYTNYYNYGVTLLYSAEIVKNLSCSMGINYSTKNYYCEAFPSEYQHNYTRWEYYTKYVNIPLYLNYQFIHTHSFGIKILQGFYLNYRADHDFKRYETGLPVVAFNNQDRNGIIEDTGLVYRCGSIFSYLLNTKLNINIIPFFDYKLVLGYKPGPRTHLSEDRISFGASIGVEYKF